MARRMPGLVNYAPEHGSVELREVSVPEIGEQDVLLKVQAVSICGSDFPIAAGTAAKNSIWLPSSMSVFLRCQDVRLGKV